MNDTDHEPEEPPTEAPKPDEPVVIPAAALLDDEAAAAGAEETKPESKPESIEPPSNVVEIQASAKPKDKAYWFRRIVIAVVLLLFVLPPVLTVIYRLIPPPITMLMIERLFQGQGLSKHWRGLNDISPALPQAVIAAEDARFCEHHGFDFKAMREAAIHNERRPGKVRGGSTISQQTAKNVFLWPSRDYVRKGLEAWFTVLEETIWGKRRILETYLNVVEWGPGTYGAQAAAQRYFGKDAVDLTPDEAARLAAILPDPLKWKAVNPGRYVQRRSAKIGARAAVVRQDDLAWCVRR